MVGQGKGSAGGEGSRCNGTGTDIGGGKRKCLGAGQVAVQHNLVGGAGVSRVRAKANNIAIVLQLDTQPFGGGAGQSGQVITSLTNIIVIGKGDVQIGRAGAVNNNIEWRVARGAADIG